MFKLINDDAYKVIDDFYKENIKVNHIITDPPYNISKNNNLSTMRGNRTGVDFGDWDRGKFDLFSWIPKYTKLLDKNGSIIILYSHRH